MTVNLLWQDWTFRVGDDLYTLTYMRALKQWEVLSQKKYLTPVVIKDEPENATEDGARRILERL